MFAQCFRNKRIADFLSIVAFRPIDEVDALATRQTSCQRSRPSTNPAIEVGKLADIVIWKPAFFGVKPETILKGGFISWANMGDPNASIPTPQPTMYRPQFGAFGKAIAATSVTFVSQASLDAGSLDELGLSKRLVAVKGCRSVTKSDLPFNLI